MLESLRYAHMFCSQLAVNENYTLHGASQFFDKDVLAKMDYEIVLHFASFELIFPSHVKCLK